MFGLFKSDPDRDFEFHKDRTQKLLTVAFDRFIRADDYMCGKGFGGEGSKIISAQGAEAKGQSSLSEAMHNADKALKLCKGNSLKLKELWQSILSITGRAGTEHFVHHSIISAWDGSRAKWYYEFAQLSKKAFPQYKIPINSLNPQPKNEDSEPEDVKREIARWIVVSAVLYQNHLEKTEPRTARHAAVEILYILLHLVDREASKVFGLARRNEVFDEILATAIYEYVRVLSKPDTPPSIVNSVRKEMYANMNDRQAIYAACKSLAGDPWPSRGTMAFACAYFIYRALERTDRTDVDGVLRGEEDVTADRGCTPEPQKFPSIISIRHRIRPNTTRWPRF